MISSLFQIATADLRRSIADALSRVFYAGHRFIITKNGKPFAALVTVDDYRLLAQLREQADQERADARAATMPTAEMAAAEPAGTAVTHP